MKIKTADLSGAALDWAVAKSEGKHTDCEIHAGNIWYGRVTSGFLQYSPSTNWQTGGPIIENEGIETICNLTATEASRFENAYADWQAFYRHSRQTERRSFATTPLIAAMKAYVTNKLGHEVEVPDELI